MDEVIPPAIRVFTPHSGCPHSRSVNEVCDSNARLPLQVKPNIGRAIVLPLEGKGDRSAVDEVIPPAIRIFTSLSGRPFSRSVLRPSPCRRRGTAIAVDEV